MNKNKKYLVVAVALGLSIFLNFEAEGALPDDPIQIQKSECPAKDACAYGLTDGSTATVDQDSRSRLAAAVAKTHLKVNHDGTLSGIATINGQSVPLNFVRK
ncbi:MAG: hypothetical protein JSR85_04760 [Proteobacteria bacterium]|nr:hypothetical protein [Pseudomonadota bacterium]